MSGSICNQARQFSPSDTIPTSPTSLPGGEEQNRPFARLVPINRGARLAFDSVIDAIKQDRDAHSHVHRNIFIEPLRNESGSASSEFTDSETAEGGDQRDRPSYRYAGYFCFRLSNPPRVPRIGWVLGDGRGQSVGQVDFLLSTPRLFKDIAGKHFMIYIHPRTCRLILLARHRVTMLAPGGGSMTIALSKSTIDSQRELAREEEIRLGDCVYIFEYLDFAESEEHKRQLATFMRQLNGPNWEGIPKLLAPSSEATVMRLHNYTWSLGAFAKGSFGQVTAGTASDGTPVAIKRLNRPRETQLSAHRKIMAWIGKHDNIIELVDCYAGPNANIPEAYCVYKPLASTSLYDVMGQEKISVRNQIVLFRQYLQGLVFLHDEKNVMHRDIKPSNLGIVTWNPLVGVIFDLDSATTEETSTDHFQGTLGFLAPEIVSQEWSSMLPPGMRLPLSDSVTAYGRKVDIWALGLSAYITHTGDVTVQGNNKCITARLHESIRQNLEKKIRLNGDVVSESLTKIILKMLCWDASDRLSAAEALKAFQELENQITEDIVRDDIISGMKRSHDGALEFPCGEPSAKQAIIFKK